MKVVLLVNFGGPRSKEEIFPFLSELLNDRDVIWTSFPKWMHRLIFTRVARKRAVKIAPDYDFIGGNSPIYVDTEQLAELLRKKTGLTVITFHRYLPQTHQESLRQIKAHSHEDIVVFPLFSQFSYATTGSCARFLMNHLSSQVIDKLGWISSYAAHPAYIQAMREQIREFLVKEECFLEESVLFFSAHGVPQIFVDQGDPYKQECETSYQTIMEGFPEVSSILAYQSKFGKGEWLRPYTLDVVSEGKKEWIGIKKNIVFVPLTFTSDHIETLFEVETQYLPPLRSQGYRALRCPALGLREGWVESIEAILRTNELVPTQSLIRSGRQQGSQAIKTPNAHASTGRNSDDP